MSDISSFDQYNTKTLLVTQSVSCKKQIVNAFNKQSLGMLLYAENKYDTMNIVKNKAVDIVLLDINVHADSSKRYYLQIIALIRDYFGSKKVPIIVILEPVQLQHATYAIKMGVYDYIELPICKFRMQMILKNALLLIEKERDKQYLNKDNNSNIEIIGNSAIAKKIRSQVEQYSQDSSRVLILGDKYTGKSAIARAIHKTSSRNILIEIKQGKIDTHDIKLDHLNEYLFSSNECSFTIFLDEVSKISKIDQAKILNILTKQQFSLSSNNKVKFIASESEDIDHALRSGALLNDLYHRLNIRNIISYPLSKRISDISEFCSHFLDKYCQKFKISKKYFSEDAMAILQSYRWPNNILQLEKMIAWILAANAEPESKLISASTVISLLHIDNVQKYYSDTILMSIKDARQCFEREYIKMQTKRFNGNISKTSNFIKMERSALHRKIKNLKINFS